MTLAQHLYELIYQQPISEARTALLFASRPEWSATDCRRYVEAMARRELEEAFVLLAGAIARFPGQEYSTGIPRQALDGDYPPNGTDL
jgi:hypothetical protein